MLTQEQAYFSGQYIDQIIFQSSLVQVGIFRCRPCYPHFNTAGEINHHLIVFPRTSVRISQAGYEPLITDPNLVVFYNQGQDYRREKISDRGDVCEWFAYDDELVVQALSVYDPQVEEHPQRPFRMSYGPSDPAVYLLQRMVVEHVRYNRTPDRLFVEEAALSVLGKAAFDAHQYWMRAEGSLSSRSNPDHKELAYAVRKLLATRFTESLTLVQIAAELHYSPYHLCRIFRQQTGSTIHRYLDQLRLHSALESVTQGESNLTQVALNLGYSSHSHFTQSFRRTFGTPPSRLRDMPAPQLLGQLSKNLIA
jgi:AraC family transcriptional regulator